MQIKVFTLPLQPTDEQTEELNHFLRAKKVIDVKKELGKKAFVPFRNRMFHVCHAHGRAVGHAGRSMQPKAWITLKF